MTKEDAVSLREFPAWISLCETEIDGINGLIESARNKLETNRNERERDILQERIKALRELKALPQNIIEREE